MKIFEEKYRHLTELANVFAAMDDFFEQGEQGLKTSDCLEQTRSSAE